MTCVFQGAALGHLDIGAAQQLQQPGSGQSSAQSLPADTTAPLPQLPSSLSLTQLDDAQSSNRERLEWIINSCDE